MKFLPSVDYFGRTETSETSEKKNNMDIGSSEKIKTVKLSYIFVKQIESDDMEKGIGDRRKWRN